MQVKKMLAALAAAGALSALTLPVPVLAADAEPAPAAAVQAPAPAPEAEAQPGTAPADVRGQPRGFAADRPLPPPQDFGPQRHGAGPRGFNQPGPGSDQVYAGWCGRGFWQQGPQPDWRGYGPGLEQILTDSRYSKYTDEIEKLEDMLFVEGSVLKSMQQNPDTDAASVRVQAKNVVELKNRLDAQYDALMQKYAEDNGDNAVPGYSGGRQPHHFMRHHRGAFHW